MSRNNVAVYLLVVVGIFACIPSYVDAEVGAIKNSSGTHVISSTELATVSDMPALAAATASEADEIARLTKILADLLVVYTELLKKTSGGETTVGDAVPPEKRLTDVQIEYVRFPEGLVSLNEVYLDEDMRIVAKISPDFTSENVTVYLKNAYRIYKTEGRVFNDGYIGFTFDAHAHTMPEGTYQLYVGKNGLVSNAITVEVRDYTEKTFTIISPRADKGVYYFGDPQYIWVEITSNSEKVRNSFGPFVYTLFARTKTQEEKYLFSYPILSGQASTKHAKAVSMSLGVPEDFQIKYNNIPDLLGYTVQVCAYKRGAHPTRTNDGSYYAERDQIACDSVKLDGIQGNSAMNGQLAEKPGVTIDQVVGTSDVVVIPDEDTSAPVITITPNRATIKKGERISISWEAKGSSLTCTDVSGYTSLGKSEFSNSNTFTSEPLNTYTQYAVQCTGANGKSGTKFAKIFIDGESAPNPDAKVPSTGSGPSVNMVVFSPTHVYTSTEDLTIPIQVGGKVNLIWTVTSNTSATCSAAQKGMPTYSNALSGSYDSDAILYDVTYTLICKNDQGTTSREYKIDVQ